MYIFKIIITIKLNISTLSSGVDQHEFYSNQINYLTSRCHILTTPTQFMLMEMLHVAPAETVNVDVPPLNDDHKYNI